MLLLEDPGGEVLARLVGQPWEVRPFLCVALGLAGVLGQLHAQGLIHKDIKPAHMLVNMATAEVRLTGFGLASRLPRERPVAEPPEVIAGTLAYMAPEQTGRMNRSIDSRSDLYAYGVTLYEMLTGALPFTATEPLEWIHIARHPTPPTERMPGIPASIAAIVMKLLAKTAEERYQTTAGVEADLRRCLVEWEAHGHIAPFPLGTQDMPDRLLIPKKLYGRERESNALLAAFDQVVASGRPELVLVSGYAGIGKSAVVQELHKALVPPCGLFASGKFDQYKRDIPYATLAQAFQSLVRQILGQSEVELSRWRDGIRQAVGSNGQLIVNLIPELELVIGKQPPVLDVPPQDAQNRFQLVFQRFLGVFARPDHPLALFLDDLQWLDVATPHLLEYLVTEQEVPHILLVGAYRDNEVGPSHPLMRTLAAIRTAEASVREIILAPLGLDHVAWLVADALHCEREHAQPLAQLVHEKTAGNPFFAIQFITALAEERLIAFDRGAATWTWDLAHIQAKSSTDNVVDLMVGKLSRLPASTQDVLKQLACLGNRAATATLSMIRGTSEAEIHEALWEAVRAGLVFRLDAAYTFLHDRVQEAAYALIPEGERAAVHLRIGRLFATYIPAEQREEAIFEIVNQLNRCTALITSREEREQVAELNLTAGTRAKAATAYTSALTYLAAGAALLAEDGWERHNALTFALALHRAECEFLTGDMAAADERLSMLSGRATNLVDRAAVTCLRMALYTTLDQPERAVAVCLDYLRHVGVEWSPQPTEGEVKQEFERLWCQLGSRSIEALLDLPLMTDGDWRTTMDVLAEAARPAQVTNRSLHRIVLGRMANLSLEHGHSDGSCLAYVWLGLSLGPWFGDYSTGSRFAKLAVDLVDKRGLDRFKARVYLCFGASAWTQRPGAALAFMRRAFDWAQETGDLTCAAYGYYAVITQRLVNGDDLSEVQREAENVLAFAQKARFGLVIDFVTGQLQLIRTLRGLTPMFGSFTDAEFDESQFEQHLNGDPRLAVVGCWYWFCKLQAHCYAADYPSALAAAMEGQRLLWITQSHFQIVNYHFYSALARAASCASALADERPQHFAALVAHHQQLVLLAEHGPENFGNLAVLIGAEIARLEGRELDAERLYEDAIRLTRAQGFIQNEGLANERAAHFYAARGFETIAHAYLRNARYCYLRWGAEGKVRQLEQAHPHLREQSTPLRPTTTIGAPIEHLDFGTVVTMSQAVSSEIVLEKLIETLMVIVVEHAGAERGLLILLRGDALRIEAEATTTRDGVEVRLRQASVTLSELPESILHYVIRTQESVVLDDALVQNLFSADAYFHQTHARSVLCLPLVKQTRLIGVLYLENTLAPHVFTPARIAVLELLASQAAISLENARLYTDLQHAEEQVRQDERELRRMVDLIPQIIIVLDPDGKPLYVNRAALEYTGLSLEEVLVNGFGGRLSHPEDVERLRAERRDALGRKIPFQLEHRVRGKDGVFRWFLFHYNPLLDEMGHMLRWYATGTDIEERKQAEERVRKENLALREEIDHSSMFEEIVGASSALQAVLARVAKVAPTDSTRSAGV